MLKLFPYNILDVKKPMTRAFCTEQGIIIFVFRLARNFVHSIQILFKLSRCLNFYQKWKKRKDMEIKSAFVPLIEKRIIERNINTNRKMLLRFFGALLALWKKQSMRKTKSLSVCTLFTFYINVNHLPTRISVDLL